MQRIYQCYRVLPDSAHELKRIIYFVWKQKPDACIPEVKTPMYFISIYDYEFEMRTNFERGKE